MAESLIQKYSRMPQVTIQLQSTLVPSDVWRWPVFDNLLELRTFLQKEASLQRQLDKVALDKNKIAPAIDEAIEFLNHAVVTATEDFAEEGEVPLETVRSALGTTTHEAAIEMKLTTYSNRIDSLEIPFLPSESPNYGILARGYKHYRQLDADGEFIEFIEIANHPNGLFVAKSSVESRQAAIVYIGLFLKDVKLANPEKLTKQQEESYRQSLLELSQSISENETELVNYVDETKSEMKASYEKDYSDTQAQYVRLEQQVQDDLADKEEKFQTLEATYQQKLAFEAPIKLWEKQALIQRVLAAVWALATVVATVVMLNVSTGFIDKLFTSKQIETPTIPQYFVPIAVVSVLLYVMRLFVNLAVSSWHMASEYAQKAAMTTYYLSMIKANEMDSKEKEIILPYLFAKIDTGLNKYQDGGTSELNALLKMVQK
ncbi:DUF6161 domain-containing protein [Weissella confusa]